MTTDAAELQQCLEQAKETYDSALNQALSAFNSAKSRADQKAQSAVDAAQQRSQAAHSEADRNLQDCLQRARTSEQQQQCRSEHDRVIDSANNKFYDDRDAAVSTKEAEEGTAGAAYDEARNAALSTYNDRQAYCQRTWGAK